MSISPGSTARRVVPTALGVTLVRGYEAIDAELSLPHMRKYIEEQIGLVARGDVSKERVLEWVLGQFRDKFKFFVENVGFQFREISSNF